MKEIDLKKGTTFVFDNESFQVAICNDDIRTCECYYDGKYNSFRGFKIWFNGRIIHSSKTFSSFEKRFEKLKKEWHLQLREFINENNS